MMQGRRNELIMNSISLAATGDRCPAGLHHARVLLLNCKIARGMPPKRGGCMIIDADLEASLSRRLRHCNTGQTSARACRVSTCRRAPSTIRSPQNRMSRTEANGAWGLQIGTQRQQDLVLLTNTPT